METDKKQKKDQWLPGRGRSRKNTEDLGGSENTLFDSTMMDTHQ